MEVKVKIHSIGETVKVSDTFQKREFVVETDEQFKQHLLLQVVKDKCEVLNNYKIGESVKVSLNLKGRLWSNPQGAEKCFNTLECWKIEKTDSEAKEMPQNSNTKEWPDDLPY